MNILNIYEEGELDNELSMIKTGNSDFSAKPTIQANVEFEKYKEQTKNELSEAEKHFIKQIETTAKKLNSKKPKK